jgi:hypothetical protein
MSCIVYRKVISIVIGIGKQMNVVNVKRLSGVLSLPIGSAELVLLVIHLSIVKGLM